MRALQLIVMSLGVLFIAWGAWLLLGDDPDGGAHALGWFMLPVGAVLALVAALLGRRPGESTHQQRRTGFRLPILAGAAVVGTLLLLLFVFGTP